MLDSHRERMGLTMFPIGGVQCYEAASVRFDGVDDVLVVVVSDDEQYLVHGRFQHCRQGMSQDRAVIDERTKLVAVTVVASSGTGRE